MTTKQALRRARELALAGDSDQAFGLLRELAEAGSVSASASLAELAAFRGEWDVVVEHAARLAAEPGAVYAGNVFDDMVRLLALAGERGRPWDEIEEAASRALRARAARLVDRYAKWLRALRALARDQGSGLVDWPAWSWSRASRSTDTEAFEAAVAKAPDVRPDLVDDPAGMARHIFSLAVCYAVPAAMIEQYFSHPAAMDFECAVKVARGLAAEDPERAWSVLEAQVPRWYPVDHAQVAPVALLIDPALRPLCTAERAAAVLATPRGPLA